MTLPAALYRTIRAIAILLLLTGAPTLLAGGTDYRTGQIEIVDSLTGNDQFDLEIGRFDIYEVALEKGDLLKVDLHSARFPAYLILVAPNDDVEIYEPQQNTASGSLLRLDIKIAATGSWLVGVLGENRDRGAYKLTCRWARANSQAPPPDTAMCTQLAFIIAHQETDYIFMRAGTEAATAKSFQPTVTPGHALSAKIHSPGSEWFNAVFYDGNDKERAQEQFNSLLAQVVSCLGPGWRHEVQKWHRYGLPGFSYVNRKYLDLIEENRAFPRFIRIEMIDNSPLPPAKRTGNFFEVSLIVNRQRPR